MKLEELDEEHEDVLCCQNESNGSSSTGHERYVKHEEHDQRDASIIQGLNQLVEDQLRMISLGTLLTLIVDVP